MKSHKDDCQQKFVSDNGESRSPNRKERCEQKGKPQIVDADDAMRSHKCVRGSPEGRRPRHYGVSGIRLLICPKNMWIKVAEGEGEDQVVRLIASEGHTLSLDQAPSSVLDCRENQNRSGEGEELDPAGTDPRYPSGLERRSRFG
jgi:hypothetical protein